MCDWTEADACGFRHAAVLYRTAEDYAAVMLDFIRSGLTAGEPVLVASTAAHAAGLRAGLDRRGAQVELADLTAGGANPGRVLSMLRMFACDHPGRAMRCVLDQSWPGRPPEEIAEAMRHERLAAMALAGTGLRLLCAYDSRLDPGLLGAAETAHPVVVRDGRWCPSRSFAGRDREAGRDDRLSRPPPSAARLAFRDDQAAVRRFVSAEALRAGLPEHRTRDLVIAAAELAANTLMHTDGPGTLVMWATTAEVICQVSDCGRITDPLAGTLRPDPAATTRHRGLWLVHQVGDLVQIRSGPAGTTVRVHMRLGT